jgi:hypothetical protein
MMIVEVDLSSMELADKKVLLALAIDVGPTGRRVARAFDPDRHSVRLEPDRWLEFGGATKGPQQER